MNGKNLSIFLSGVLIALMGVGAVWYVGSPAQRMASSESDPMAGMDMGQQGGSSIGSSGGTQADVVRVPQGRRQLIGVKTAEVGERQIETSIRAVGTVDYDERRVRQVTLRVPGWITRLHADYTGRPVKKGEPLLTLYSPDWVATQEEYLLAQRTLARVTASPVAHIRTGAESQVAAARDRLRLLNMTEEQIVQLERNGKPQRETTIYAPTNGVVTKKMAVAGMFATPEMSLYEIADTSIVWLNANIYEHELARVKMGEDATVTLTAYPGETFNGKIVYIAPSLDNETRTVKVRLEFHNPDGQLKPGMYGNVEIKTKGEPRLAVPHEAVLDSGTRKRVFVDRGGGTYEPREVTVGHKTGGFYPVLANLAAGEKVVTSGNFLIDSESQLMAATNMMGMLGMGGVQMEQATMGKMEMAGREGRMEMDMDMSGMKMASPSSSREQTVGDLTLSLATDPEPPKKGENRLRLTVLAKGAPVTDAKVTLNYTMTMPGMEIESIDAKQTGSGVYEGTADLAMRGAWEVEAIILRGFGKPVKAKFAVTVGK
jgi:Cu(I)/Ag(I) efflux system membrane fusion protein